MAQFTMLSLLLLTACMVCPIVAWDWNLLEEFMKWKSSSGQYNNPSGSQGSSASPGGQSSYGSPSPQSYSSPSYSPSGYSPSSGENQSPSPSSGGSSPSYSPGGSSPSYSPGASPSPPSGGNSGEDNKQSVPGTNNDYGGWQEGRGTFYGTDAWPIHKGSCGYGYLDPDVNTGWDVVAVGDRNPDFPGSCGVCYEVQCRKATFHDGYGEKLERQQCYNEEASVIVQAVDTCACVYLNNQSSNKRWCCGDMQHLDLSKWAFEKLADPNQGVMGIRFRRVPCGHTPAVKAAAQGPTTKKDDFMGWKPGDWDKSKDKRFSGPVYQSGQRSSDSNPAKSDNGR